MRWETCLKASKIIREAIAKILHYGIICALLSVILAASAHGSIDTKEIITPAERLWLTENQSRIVLAVETGYAPFLFLDSKDQPNGLAHDYMLLLESKLGFRFRQRRFASLDDIFSKVRSGEVHVVNAVTKTPWRSEFLSFTESFITVPNVIVVRKERLGQMREGDLTG
ncbi:MAG: transporter substrate-binding domain-containing protein, partial [Deltaproteobacteria bacterium]